MDLSGSMQGAGGVGGLLAIEEKTGTHAGKYYPLYDGNGNVTELVKTGGTTGTTLVAHYEYDPFGNLTQDDDSDSSGYNAVNPFKFSTKYHDEETGLYYYGYRYYDAAVGRWISRDPIEEDGGLNLYGFVGNDGLNRWDYLGLVDPNNPAQKHHWFPQQGGKGAALFKKICGAGFDIDNFTTLMSGVAHHIIEDKMRYGQILKEFLESSPDCCELLDLIQGMMMTAQIQLKGVEGVWFRTDPNGRIELREFENGGVATNDAFDKFYGEKCGKRRWRCGRSAAFTKAFNAFAGVIAGPVITKPNTNSGNSGTSEDEHRRLRDDDDYRRWWYLNGNRGNESPYERSTREQLERDLHRRFPNVVPFRRDVERRIQEERVRRRERRRRAA